MDPRNQSASMIGLFVMVTVAVAGPTFLNQTFGPSRDATIDRVLAQAAGEINKTLPLMYDSESELTTVGVLPGNVVVYSWTLPHYSRDQIDPVEVTQAVRRRIINQYRTNPGMKTFRDAQVTMRHQYADKDGIFVTEVIVSPRDIQ